MKTIISTLLAICLLSWLFNGAIHRFGCALPIGGEMIQAAVRIEMASTSNSLKKHEALALMGTQPLKNNTWWYTFDISGTDDNWEITLHPILPPLWYRIALAFDWEFLSVRPQDLIITNDNPKLTRKS